MIRIPFLLLLVFSVFNMNLMLQCALGLNGAASSKNHDKNHDKILSLIKLSIIFISVILLWFVFSRIIFLTVSWIFIYVLLFPVSYIVYDGLEFILFRYIIKKDLDGSSIDGSSFDRHFINGLSAGECSISFPGGITAAAVFICLNIANGILEVLILSFGFTAGILLVSLILNEIRKRAALEEVPRFLRGKSLVLISMGMLSLVFSVGSLLLLRMINF